MRILMTADPVGGVWTYALALAAGLQRHDVDVVLAVMGGPVSAAQHAQARGLRNVTIVDSAFRLEWMQDPWSDVAAAGDWLRRMEQETTPDVVHLNGYCHAALPWSAPVLVAGHSCVLSWWQAVHGTDAPAEWLRYREAVAAGLSAADAVVTPTRAMLDALREHYGPVHRGRVIPNGCDPAPLPLGARDAFGRYARAPRLPEPFVFAAGRVWDASKGLGTLAEAAPSIRWPVFIAGSCEHPAGGRIELPGVHLLGPVAPAAMLQWHRRASIFVHPAVYEPFGLAPLEAALAGSALVLADIPSLREVWGDAAVFVPPRDAAALAVAVNTLIAQPLRLASLSAAARERARTMSVRRMAREYNLVYRQLKQQGAARALEVVACAS